MSLPAASHLDSLETPSAVVDLDVLERNLARGAAYASKHGFVLRPHVKTHKSLFVAGEQLRLGARGLTCATPFEAEVMSSVCNDLLIAYPPAGTVGARRVAAIRPDVQLKVALDSPQVLEVLAAAAETAGRKIGVYVEIDVGMRRVGVTPGGDALALAQRIGKYRNLEFAGVAFYPGHIRGPIAAQDDELADLAALLNATLDAFDRAGLTPPTVSGGSTPTFWRTHELPRITEIRPGSYVYNDRESAGIGACTIDDCALTVLATVVSAAVPGQVVINAGTKALGREPVRGEHSGFGQLLGRPDVTVSRMSEEHGILDLSKTDWRPEIGERVRVVPNHVCIVTHLNDLIYGVRGDKVERSWPVDARGRGFKPIS
jgi:D-serine deaminase-like pyridoxal phosphate-dependent protein